MAYCKYCGKLIPEGGSCDCPAAKGEAGISETAENIQNTNEDTAESLKSEAAEAVQEVKEVASDTINDIKSEVSEAAQKVDAVAGEAAEKLSGKAKKSKGLVYIVAGIIAALFIFLIIAMCSSGGATSAVKRYIKSSYEKRGAKTMYSLTLPKRVIKELKEDDDYDEMVDSYNDMIEDMIDDLDGKETLPKYDKITRMNQMKKSEL